MKQISLVSVIELENEILSKLFPRDGLWACTDCEYERKNKNHVIEHIEAKHVNHPAYECGECGKLCTTRNTLRQHKRVHKPVMSDLFVHPLYPQLM